MKKILSNTAIAMLSIISFTLNGQELPNCFLENFEPKVATVPPYTEV